MKSKILSLVAALALAVGSAGSAKALTSFISSDWNAQSLAPVFSVSGTTATVDFAWDSDQSKPLASAYTEFVTDSTIEIFLTGYGGSAVPSDKEHTGFMLRKVGSATNLTTDTGFCGHVEAMAEVRGRCNLATNLVTSTHPVVYRPSATTPVMTVGPGTYYLGYWEGNGALSGTMSFQLSEVPLPAGGLLLIGALSGLFVARRRKTAS